MFKQDGRIKEYYSTEDIEGIITGKIYDEYVLMIAFIITENKLKDWLQKVGHKRDVKKAAYIASNFDNYSIPHFD